MNLRTADMPVTKMYKGWFLQLFAFGRDSFVILADRVTVGTPFADRSVRRVTASTSCFISGWTRSVTDGASGMRLTLAEA
jgi:hypothetical protein